MRLEEKYTTDEKKTKDSEKEKDKTVISNDAYAQCEFMEQLKETLENKRF